MPVLLRQGSWAGRLCSRQRLLCCDDRPAADVNSLEYSCIDANPYVIVDHDWGADFSLIIDEVIIAVSDGCSFGDSDIIAD